MEHTEPRRRGRPLTVEIEPDLMGTLGRLGLHLEEVALVVGCSRQHLHSRLCEFPELQEAYRAEASDCQERKMAVAAHVVDALREARAASA